MKTLYEILEVSETASKEMIEKAYKILAKRYHPDLQPPEKKQEAEHKMKLLNETYEILSNETKRMEYDQKLAKERESKEKEEQMKSKQTYKENIQNANKEYDSQIEKNNKYSEKQYNINQKKMQQEIQQNLKYEYERKYQKAYEDYLRSLGYKIKYKWTWKNYRDLLITILIIIAICMIIWIIPPTRNLIINFYNSNEIIKTVIDVIHNILIGIWNAICSIF